MADEKTTFTLNLDGSAGDVAEETANAFEKLRAQMAKSEGAIRQYESQLRRIKGSSAGAKDAAEQLRAKIAQEKTAVTAGNIELLKAGVSYDKLATRAKELAKEKDKLAKTREAEQIQKSKDAADAAKGPLKGLVDQFDKLGKSAASSEGALALVASGAVALIAALAALTVAAVAFGIAGAAAFTKWVVGSADAARNMNLARAAFAGSADNARALGSQVDALAAKVPTAKAELNDLAISLDKANRGTFLQGQVLVDTYNAVAQAQAAAGDETANKVREVLERGKMTGLVGINPMELIGSGIDFGDISSALAGQMHVSVQDAQTALLQGRVKLGDAAEAMRTAVEARFGKLNLAKMLSLENLEKKFHENLAALTSDINLEPLLKDIQDLFATLSPSTVSGAAIKQLVTSLGQGTIDAFHAAAPIARAFIEGMIIGAYKLYIGYLKLRIALVDTFGNQKVKSDIDWFQTAMVIGQAVVWGLTVAVLGFAGSLVTMAAPIVAFTLALKNAYDQAAKLIKKLDQLPAGIKNAANPAGTGLDIGKKLGGGIEGGFRDAIGWHSPPKLFVDARKASEEAFAGEPMAVPAVQAPPKGPPARGGRGGPSKVVLELHVDSQKTAETVMQSPNFAKLTATLEELCRAAGISLDEGEPA
jgi:hypothetical protein